MKPRVKKPFSLSIGGRFMIPSAGGSRLMARAGRLSVTRLTQRRWIGSSGLPRLKTVAMRISITSPILEVRRNWTDLTMLS